MRRRRARAVHLDAARTVRLRRGRRLGRAVDLNAVDLGGRRRRGWLWLDDGRLGRRRRRLDDLGPALSEHARRAIRFGEGSDGRSSIGRWGGGARLKRCGRGVEGGRRRRRARGGVGRERRCVGRRVDAVWRRSTFVGRSSWGRRRLGVVAVDRRLLGVVCAGVLGRLAAVVLLRLACLRVLGLLALLLLLRRRFCRFCLLRPQCLVRPPLLVPPREVTQRFGPRLDVELLLKLRGDGRDEGEDGELAVLEVEREPAREAVGDGEVGWEEEGSAKTLGAGPRMMRVGQESCMGRTRRARRSPCGPSRRPRGRAAPPTGRGRRRRRVRRRCRRGRVGGC